MIILAIDPGYDRLGWAIGQILKNNTINLMSYGAITTSKKKGVFVRYGEIMKQLSEIMNEFKPNEVALETLFFFKNQKTVMQVSEARGVILSTLLQFQCQIFEYSPPQIKMATTGYGRSDKIAMEKMVKQQLKLQTNNKVLDDTYDALAILITHAGCRKMKCLAQTI